MRRALRLVAVACWLWFLIWAVVLHPAGEASDHDVMRRPGAHVEGVADE